MPIITSDYKSLSKYYNLSSEEVKLYRNKLQSIEEFLDGQLTEETALQLYKNMEILLQNLPVHNFPLIQGSMLLRGRPNGDQQVFTRQSQISYNTDNLNAIGPGRFNLQKESMFYATIQAEERQDHWLVTAALECYKDLVNNNVTSPNQIFTFGLWKSVAPLLVTNLCFDEDALCFNIAVKERIKTDLKNIKQSIYTTSYNLIRNFWTFFSILAGKPNPTLKDYAVTTCFRIILQKIYYPRFAGIMYPSSVTEKRGLNIVLTPLYVEDCLVLKEAVMYKCNRDLISAHITGSPCSDIVEVINKYFHFQTTC